MTQQSTQAYRISGRVVDAQGGTPLARCVVEIVDVKHGFGARTVLTGEDGRFLFEGVSPSKYRLSASKHGFVTQSYEQHDEFSTAIAVGPGLVSEDLLFKLTPGAILAGTVTDESGEPVRQAQVKLFRDQDADGIRSTRQQATTYTDDRGAFEIARYRDREHTSYPSLRDPGTHGTSRGPPVPRRTIPLWTSRIRLCTTPT